jgi:hypothetical protein
MGSPQQAMPFRLAHSSLQLALRFWPEETRDWGHAIAAELHEIEKPFEALLWALGGLMLFSRASASHFLAWLKLPAGSRLSGAPLPLESGAPMLPKRSRLFTAAILAATALLLLLPHSHEALSTLRASWNGYQIWPADRRTLANLAAKAENNKDARTLAFVALTTPEAQEGTRLAEKAVALDPNLFWIYASRFFRPDDAQQPAEWPARMSAGDPDNSFVDLCIADALARAHYRALISHRSTSQPEIESALLEDPQWVARMEAAFRAPRYDSYLHRHWELVSYVWSRDPSLSPSIIGHGLWSHRIPNLMNLKIFTGFEVHRAQQARMEGNPQNADKVLKEVKSFGHRMVEAGDSDLETLVGLSLSRQAAQEFNTLYAATGREAEAQQPAARVQELEQLQQTFHRPSMAAYQAQQKAFRGYAVLFESTSILAVFFAFATVLSYLMLELRPGLSPRRRAVWQRALCRTADFAPASLLLLSAAFLASYLPFARLFAGYRAQEGTSVTIRELSSTLWQLVQFRYSFQSLFEGTLMWWAFTVALSLLAIFIIIRGFYRPRPATPIAA